MNDDLVSDAIRTLERDRLREANHAAPGRLERLARLDARLFQYELERLGTAPPRPDPPSPKVGSDEL